MVRRSAFFVAIVALVGCNGAQQSTNTIPQGPAALTNSVHSRSWMLPEARSNDLLYTSDGVYNEVNVYSYPGAKPVGTLTGFQFPGRMCPDKDGNVWIPNFYGTTIVEYAHGGMSPIATLAVHNISPIACAVDPTSGDLAVGGYPPQGSNERARVFVFASAAGIPKVYKVNLGTSSFCGYDNKGNLFVDGYGPNGSTFSGVVELEKGAQKFRGVLFEGQSSPPSFEPKPVQWDGRYLVFGGPLWVTRYTLSNFTAVPEGRTNFSDLHELANAWIQGSKIIVVNRGGDGSEPPVQIDRYPAGGNPIRTVDVPNDSFGVTVSLAPH
jgi:hypothetical protein